MPTPPREANATRSLAILVHALDNFEHSGYLMHDAIEHLRAQGWRVHLVQGLDHDEVTRLLHQGVPACLLHVDMTIVPDAYLRLASRFSHVCNARTIDISKRVVSAQVLSRHERGHTSWHGPVIVKTNANCGGLREYQLARASLPTRMLGAVRRRLHWTLRADLPAKCYRVYSSTREVPFAAWLNPNLIVERFAPERRGNQYCLRTWVFCHDQETLQLRYGSQPVVALPNVDSRESVPITPETLPDAIRVRRRELGFDFGKFDFTIHDGQATLFDANRTPTNRSMSQAERRELGATLGTGLARWVEGSINNDVRAYP